MGDRRKLHFTRVVALIAVQVREQRQSVTACAHAQFSGRGEKYPKRRIGAADEFVKHIGAPRGSSFTPVAVLIRLIDDAV